MVSTGTAKSFQVSHFYGVLEVDDVFFFKDVWSGVGEGSRVKGSVDCIFWRVGFCCVIASPQDLAIGGVNDVSDSE